MSVCPGLDCHSYVGLKARIPLILTLVFRSPVHCCCNHPASCYSCLSSHHLGPRRSRRSPNSRHKSEPYEPHRPSIGGPPDPFFLLLISPIGHPPDATFVPAFLTKCPALDRTVFPWRLGPHIVGGAGIASEKPLPHRRVQKHYKFVDGSISRPYEGVFRIEGYGQDIDAHSTVRIDG